MPERATAVPEREVSRGRSSWSREADKAGSKTAKDRSSGRGEARKAVAARNQFRRTGTRQTWAVGWVVTGPTTSTIATARCGPACRVVWEGWSQLAPPYPDPARRRNDREGRAAGATITGCLRPS
eukprot:gene18709-26461_t